MADFYISENGSGAKDGSSARDAKDKASVISSDYNSVTAGTDRVYILDILSSKLLLPNNLNGSAGNVQEVIATNGGGTTTGETSAEFATDGSYIRLNGGTWTVNSGARGINMFTCEFCEIINATVTVLSDGQIAIYHFMSGAHVAEGMKIDNCTITCHPDQTDAVTFAMSSTGGDSAYYLNTTFSNNTVYNGKLLALIATANIDQVIHTDGRNPAGWLVEGNTFIETGGNAVQIGFTQATPASVIRGNTFTDCGRLGTTVNVIQTNWNLGLTIEDNIINNPQNPGGSGDGAGIMPDWTAVGSDYSDGIVCQGNRIDSADTAGLPAAAGLHNWAANNTQLTGNLITNSDNGMVQSEGLAPKSGTVTGITEANPTVLTYTPAGVSPERFSYRDSDTATVTLTGNTPDVTATEYTLTYVSETQVSIPVTTTSAGSGGTISIGHRTTSCKWYNNTSVNNTTGMWSKTGAQNADVQNCIFVNGTNGIKFTDENGGTLPSENNNCFYNNSGDDIDNDGSPATIDATSTDEDPLFVDPDNGNYELQSTSPCVGTGSAAWWGTGPRPHGANGEPYPDTQIDMGAYQSAHDSGHPLNL